MLLPLQEFFFTYHRSQDFLFRQVSLAGFFWGGIVTPPSVICNGLSLTKGIILVMPAVVRHYRVQLLFNGNSVMVQPKLKSVHVIFQT